MGMTKVSVKKSGMVKPMDETPGGSMWLSCLDLVFPASYHSRSVYFFRWDGSANFFDAEVVKEALRRTLVMFYPLAGRLRKDEKGRVEINLNGEGVLFVEAECDAALDELPTFSSHLSLIPPVDYSKGISSFPLSLLQLTRFKCGGVSLGVANEHHVADGFGGLNYINTWSEMARGLTPSAPPFLDRRVLAARDPPRPEFPHVEHQPPPSLKTPLDISETSFKVLGLSREQINALKRKCNQYSTYEVMAGHAWRCACISRGLPPDQESKMQLPVDGRPKLKPPLPPHYLGNAIFYTTATALCGDLASRPLEFAVGKIHESVARMDDEYLRSALDYLELELPRSDCMVRTENTVKCPNFEITSWVRLPFYEADFGWGKPYYAGPGAPPYEGKSYLFPDTHNQGGLLLAITLLKPHMDLFQDLFYHI